MFMNVDLPEPDGPITATNSPWSMARDTDCRAGGVPGADVSYCLPRFSTSMKRPAMALEHAQADLRLRAALARLVARDELVAFLHVAARDLRPGGIGNADLDWHGDELAVNQLVDARSGVASAGPAAPA